MIGGKVLDPSALAALVRGPLSAVAWFATARTLNLALYVPALALVEVRAVRPDAAAQLAEVKARLSEVVARVSAHHERVTVTCTAGRPPS